MSRPHSCGLEPIMHPSPLHGLGTLLVFAAGAVAQDPVGDLITPVHHIPASLRTAEASAVRAGPDVRRSSFVRINPKLLVPGRVFELDVFDTSHRAVFRRTSSMASHRTLLGKFDGGQDDGLVFTVGRRGAVAASIDLHGASYTLSYTGFENIHALRELDPSDRVAPCGCPDDAPRTSQNDSRNATVVAATSNTTLVDIAAFYTPAARMGAGGREAIEAELVLRTEMANLANEGGAVPWRFRLIYIAETQYVASGTGAALGHFQGAQDGEMDEVHKVRPVWGADLMVLITDPASSFTCGVSNTMRTLSTSFRTQAFSYTWRACLTRHTMTHEMGHNAGLHHEGRRLGGLFPYSYGYATPNNEFGSIMAIGGAVRANLWSSPNTMHQGFTMGAANTEDSARSLTEVGSTMAAFYPTRAPEAWEHGGGVAGSAGQPSIGFTGTVTSAPSLRVELELIPANALGILVLGAQPANTPIFGGTLVPAVGGSIPVSGNPTSATIGLPGLRLLPSGTSLWMQALFLDATAPAGVTMSDGLEVVVP